MTAPDPARAPICSGRHDWTASTSIVFPVAALVLAGVCFLLGATSHAMVAWLAVALAPWAFIAGGVRVQHLVLAIATFVPVSFLVIAEDNQGALFLAVVAISWMASEGSRSVVLASFVAGTVISIFCESTNGGEVKPWWVIWGTGMGFGWFAGALLHRQRDMVEELSRARQELAMSAIANERKQIAREVHDIVGHSLTVVLLNVVGARRRLASDPAAAAEALERAEAVSRDSLDTVRSVVGLLSSGSDSQADAPLPGGADVVPLIDRARRSGLPVRLRVDGDPAELEPALGLTLVRVLQEALSNASRHAPGATVDVQLAVDRQAVVATVANDLGEVPVGGAAAAAGTGRTGLGLSSMADRVAAVQGTLDVGVRDRRWVVRAVLPRAMHRAPTAVPATLQD